MEITTQILEGPRLEANLNIKLDTSLEQELLREYQDTSGFSPRSVLSEVASNLDKFGCSHNKLVSHDGYDNCTSCGVYVSKNGVRTYKSKKMGYSAFFSPNTIFQALVKRSQQFKQSQNPEYIKTRQSQIEWVLELADKLRISANSAHLGIHLLDTVMFRDPSLTQKVQLYAPVCLLLAAKTIELDERIPFIPKLRRYASSTYSLEEYRTAELYVLDLVDWNCQFTTALELTEFFLCQGVLFSSDEVDDGSNTSKSAKKSPGGLRENTQHVNTPKGKLLSEKRGDERRESPEKFMSPATKENNENSFSDASTMGTNTDNLGTPYNAAAIVLQVIEDEIASPKPKQKIFKQVSTPAYAEILNSNLKLGALPEREIEDLFVQFEIGYLKLLTFLIRDVDFVEWEQRVLSAASIAFFRNANRIVPVWNNELENITHLKYSQIAACFELINKKYSTSFRAPKLHAVLSAEKNKEFLSELKLINKNVTLSDKSGYGHTTVQKYNIASNIVVNDAVTEQKVLDKKPIFPSQPKATTAGIANPALFVRDDLRGRSKYPNGTINTELPQKNTLRNPIFPPSYQPSKFQPSQDGVATVASTNMPSAGNYMTTGDDLMPCKNPTNNPTICTKTLENTQPLQTRPLN